MIQAITNQQIALKYVPHFHSVCCIVLTWLTNSVVAELIIGYALPGKPVAMMLFKTWGYYTMYQALQFTSDMKLGHYMKVP